MRHSHRIPLATAAAAVALAMLPAPARAQRTAPASELLRYERATTSVNGYVSADVQLRYQFQVCAGDVHLVYGVDRSTLDVHGDRYYYNGQQYTVPADTRPRPEVFDFRAEVRHGATEILKTVHDPYTHLPLSTGCLGQTTDIFNVRRHLGAGQSSASLEQYMAAMWLKPGRMGVLRSSAAEAWIQRQTSSTPGASTGPGLVISSGGGSSGGSSDEARREEQRREEARQEEARRADEQRREEEKKRAEDEKQRQDGAESSSAGTDAEQRAEESIRAMNARQQMLYGEAQRAERAGNRDRALELYEQVCADGLGFYAKLSCERRDQLRGEVIADGVAATGRLIGRLDNALDGTGLVFGVTYHQLGLPGDKGTVGITLAGVLDTRQRWFPYADLTMGLGADESQKKPDVPFEVLGEMAAGTTLPWLRWFPSSSSVVAPHFGFRWVGTMTRAVNVGQTGLMYVSGGAMLRFDAVMVAGKPQWGASIARVF